jgi:hypothetical protein
MSLRSHPQRFSAPTDAGNRTRISSKSVGFFFDECMPTTNFSGEQHHGSIFGGTRVEGNAAFLAKIFCQKQELETLLPESPKWWLTRPGAAGYVALFGNTS